MSTGLGGVGFRFSGWIVEIHEPTTINSTSTVSAFLHECCVLRCGHRRRSTEKISGKDTQVSVRREV